MSTGVIKKVAGPLVIAEGMRDANMFDVVRVSNQRLIGEIIEMHGDEDTAEVQHGRQDGPEGDLTVGDIHIFGHEERGRAHDGRHDLTAGRGRRLDRAGEFLSRDLAGGLRRTVTEQRDRLARALRNRAVDRG